ncbi:MAG: hypothetical protein A2X86_03215 [Bdellovibrionales bacterium GWA2_49_15]|nr:MAG: hypothetical protein A2X86_03215 [Bdellovibrionales bacterium GWA2_49_15]HAZ12224.1 hypothetical protein [Bdellovibrionales bacterium]
MEKKVQWALVALMFLSFVSHANDMEGVYTVIIKKQQEKKSTRWTLSDWLATKKKIALMDQWLALNSKSTLFEARLGGSVGDVEETSDGNPVSKKQVSRYEAEFLIKMLGIGGEIGRLGPHQKFTAGELQLMILGSSLQSTHLRGFYGMRKLEWDGLTNFSGPYYGGHLTLYIFNFFGIDGRYQYFSKTKGTDKTYATYGEALTFGAFLDLSFVRLGAKLYKENLRLEQSGNFFSAAKNEGTLLTASIFF